MTDNTKIALGLALITTATVLSAKDYLKIKRQEEEKREEIAAYEKAEINRLWHVAGIVKERIRRGDYNDRGFEAVLTDLEFERIVDQST